MINFASLKSATVVVLFAMKGALLWASTQN